MNGRQDGIEQRASRIAWRVLDEGNVLRPLDEVVARGEGTWRVFGLYRADGTHSGLVCVVRPNGKSYYADLEGDVLALSFLVALLPRRVGDAMLAEQEAFDRLADGQQSEQGRIH
jgi:hypothetical protein